MLVIQVEVLGGTDIFWSSMTTQARGGGKREGTIPVSEKAVRLEKFLFT